MSIYSVASAFPTVTVPATGRMIAPTVTPNPQKYLDTVTISSQGTSANNKTVYTAYSAHEAPQNLVQNMREAFSASLWYPKTVTTVEAYYGDSLVWTSTVTSDPTKRLSDRFTYSTEIAPEWQGISNDSTLPPLDKEPSVFGFCPTIYGFTNIMSGLTFKATEMLYPSDESWAKFPSDLKEGDQPPGKVRSTYEGTEEPCWLFGVGLTTKKDEYHKPLNLSDILNAPGAKEIAADIPDIQKAFLSKPGVRHTTVEIDGKVLSILSDEKGQLINTTMDGKFVFASQNYTWQFDQQRCQWMGTISDLQGNWVSFDMSSSSESNSGGIFTGASNPFAGLSKLLGMKSMFNTKAPFLDTLDKLIADESDELTKILGEKLTKAGLGDVTKKITFAEDKDGKIVIEGNISAKQKRQLAKIINDDPELVERIKTQKARMEIAEELKKDDADLTNKKFDAARTQLLKSFLNEKGYSLDDVDTARLQFDSTGKTDERFNGLNGLFNSFPELNGEIDAYRERQNAPEATAVALPGETIKLGGTTEKTESTAVRSLLSMKRGELLEATDEAEENFDVKGMTLRADIYKTLVDKYNAQNKDDWAWQITKFSMKIEDKGQLRITDVETSGGNPQANAQAEGVLNSWLANIGQESPLKDDETNKWIREVRKIKEDASNLGLAMLEAHDDEHGDVKEYRHEVYFGSGFHSGVQILSPDADRAALAEMDMLTQDIGTALGNFFGATMKIENPFGMMFGADGLLSFEGGALSSLESDAVKQVLDDMNRYLSAEEAGEDASGMLSPELTGMGEKLLALKEVQGKIHDKSLLPKEGILFAV
jgi:hypothetical protein